MTDVFDPLEEAKKTEELVVRDAARKYHRFRPARFYGGIATADCVGCCLRCAFCWSWREVVRPEAFGTYCSPDEVARRLISIARSRGYRLVRVSGNEPTIGRGHLLSVLERIPSDLLFILETNGILIGSDRSYAESLAEYENLHVRVSLKGASEEDFSRLTGAAPEAFRLQLKALEHLLDNGVRVHPSCMISFSGAEAVESLRNRLESIEPSFREFEVEELTLYPHVELRLKELGIHYLSAHSPRAIPPDQI
ncbi:MAG: radical SAM protein [Thermoplasmata archaeon]